MALDSPTAAPRTLIKGSDPYTYPFVSRDGQLIEFDHTVNGVAQLFVANLDGSNVRPLAGTYRDWTWTEWSADSSKVGIVSTIDGDRAITWLPIDGSPATTLDLGHDVLSFWPLADGRIAFTGAEQPGDACRPDGPANVCALFVVNADGTGLKPILTASQFSGLSTHASPDGRSVLYVRWADGEAGGLHIVDIATGHDHRVADDAIPSATVNANNAWFSPDGTHILFDWLGETQNFWAVVPVAGGPIVKIGPAWTPDTMPEAAYSPDGLSIMASYPQADGTTKLLLLDPTGQKPDQPLSIPATYAPVWQRVGR